MIKPIIIFIIFIFLISIDKCDDEEDSGYLIDNTKEIERFKKSLKEYLIKNELFESEKIIEKDEMKKIFFDIILVKPVTFIPEYLQEMLEYLSNFFIEKYYKNKKEIRGKEVYDLIDIVEISRKFEEMTEDDYSEPDEEKNKTNMNSDL